MNLILIGCGGAAQYGYVPIVQLLRRKLSRVLIYDGDKFEKKNITRQAFAMGGLGRNKAAVMAEQIKTSTGIVCEAREEYFFSGILPSASFRKNDLIVVMADNHRARREARDFADKIGCWLVSAACENTSGEAWAYHRDNKGSPFDPFAMYPEMETDDGNDPIAAEGCTGEEVLDQFPQTSYGNMVSAAMAVYLINNQVLGSEHNDPMIPVAVGFSQSMFFTTRQYDHAIALDAAQG